jgi:TP901-1 family phage major tail protein
MATFYNGALILLKVGTVAAGTTVGGCTVNSYSEKIASIDITTKDNYAATGTSQTLLGGGVRSASITASGKISNDAGYSALETAFLTGQPTTLSMVGIQSTKEVEGSFLITSLEATGSHDNEQTFSFTAESSGVITRT